MTYRHGLPPATPEQVIARFAGLYHGRRYFDMLAWNWGTEPAAGRAERFWDVPGTCTYINGIKFIADHDYESAYFIEVCDQTGEGTWMHYYGIEFPIQGDPIGERWAIPAHPFAADWDNRPSELDQHLWFARWHDANRKEV